MRRDKNDKAWKQVKHIIKERDGEACRLTRIISVGDMYELRKKAGPLLYKLDPAHFIAVSESPSLIYDPNNLVMLNRYSHNCLDNFKNPITGEHITKEEVFIWWKKIIKGNSSQFNNLSKRGVL